VPNLTIGPPVVAAMKKVATKPLDVHLMIEDPWRYRDAFLDAGAAAFTFHVEIADRGDARGLIDAVRARGVLCGMSLQPDTPAERLRPWLERLDLVLIMSVFAGFGGQKFMPQVLPKAAALRRFGFRGEISMDGGIATSTIAQSAQAGVNVFVAGTAVFSAADRSGRIAELRALAEGGRTLESGTARS
jgi:ribulose-phosphate 3-epimerase